MLNRRSWLALVIVAGCSSTKTDNPRLDATGLGFELYLPPAMQRSLDALSPGLRLVRSAEYRADVREASASEGGAAQALFAVVRDFDGDGRDDVVVEGASATDSSLVVVAILNKDKPESIEVARFPYDASAVGIYLSKIPPPMIGAFEVVDYPDATTVYLYRDGKFQGVKTSS